MIELLKSIIKHSFGFVRLCFLIAWLPFRYVGRYIIKPILIRRWSRAIANRRYDTTYKTLRGSEPKNLCGGGGHGQNQVHKKTWVECYNEKNMNPLDTSKYELKRSAKESYFFEYFGPLEAWCEKYFVGDFALWSDDTQIYLLITNEYDQTYFALKWGGKLPKFNDLAAEYPVDK